MNEPFAPDATPNFDRLAHVYRWLEWITFGPWLHVCRCAFLSSSADRSRALILGDGDGRFTARLLRTNTQIQVDAVDASPVMLQELIRRAGVNARRVRTYCDDLRSWLPENNSYDLIVSHFCLDCLTTNEIQSLAERLRQVSSPSAIWVISEFAVPRNSYGRLLAHPLVTGLYSIFGMLTGLNVRALPDHRTALHNSGWVLARERKHLAGLLTSELWKMRNP